MDSTATRGETVGAVNPMTRGEAAQEGGQLMAAKEEVELSGTVGAVNPMTRTEAAPETRGGQRAQKEDPMDKHEAVYEFHFNPKCEVTGRTAAEVAGSAEEVAAYSRPSRPSRRSRRSRTATRA